MNKIARNLAAAALLLGPALAVGAQAQESVQYPRDFGTPRQAAAEAAQPRNVVGGGEARLVGTGEEARVVYSGPVRSQAPLYSHIVGHGEDARIVYSASPDRAATLSRLGHAPGTQARLEDALPGRG